MSAIWHSGFFYVCTVFFVLSNYTIIPVGSRDRPITELEHAYLRSVYVIL